MPKYGMHEIVWHRGSNQELTITAVTTAQLRGQPRTVYNVAEAPGTFYFESELYGYAEKEAMKKHDH